MQYLAYFNDDPTAVSPADLRSRGISLSTVSSTTDGALYKITDATQATHS